MDGEIHHSCLFVDKAHFIGIKYAFFSLKTTSNETFSVTDVRHLTVSVDDW